jgi:hypothetical protein
MGGTEVQELIQIDAGMCNSPHVWFDHQHRTVGLHGTWKLYRLGIAFRK